MVDTVLFDLDNTLLDFNKAEKIAVESSWMLSSELLMAMRWSSLYLSRMREC